ncbi:MAG TPA: glycine oxidase ThiO [Pirellulaceae bacterium]|nr:glycine oxidase ThiO [Pirellulaceae bacterium]
MYDFAIIGGGVIGLSLAWQLARRGSRVRLIDRGQPGKEASWAGAGILPPASLSHALHPYDRLRALASQLHVEWSAELRSETGIDTGYRRCGGWHVARTAGEAAALAAWVEASREERILVERVPLDELPGLEPGLSLGSGAARVRACYLAPDEAQLRNPRHLQALAAACAARGVEVTPHVEAAQAVIQRGQIVELQTSAGPIRAGGYCYTAGAWTGQLMAQLGVPLNVLPIRGQIVLFRCQRPPLARIVNEGSRYLVPRDDGRLLAGSTEEEVGFDKRTTSEAIRELTQFACQLVPTLAAAEVEQTWAGLRPGSLDGLPYMGRLPGHANAFVAAGHFRSGLYLSPAVAVVMSQLLLGETPQIDLGPFGVLR